MLADKVVPSELSQPWPKVAAPVPPFPTGKVPSTSDVKFTEVPSVVEIEPDEMFIPVPAVKRERV